ncbi:MAG: hypothetical protein ACLT8E_01140 [Akkermansia sp.]
MTTPRPSSPAASTARSHRRSSSTTPASCWRTNHGEPDSTTSKEVLHMFKDLNRQQGITVILVTHDPKIAAFTDRAINMADGLICEGISDMLSKDDV